jgi:hypothetical protein|tara:strand:- start:1232 stop:1465 length:234 start_codon:yes stop_codon:yes gene_type:complete
MSNYTKTTNFTAKDTLPTGNAAKIIKGTDFDIEFDALVTAVASKANSASPTFTGTVTIPTLDVSGTLTAGTITGGTY